MATLHLICGTISSGKTTYARRMMDENPALLLSVDEVTLALSSVIPPENHDLTTPLVKQWLMTKAKEAMAAGLDVIFDWGFWKKDERAAFEQALTAEGIPHVWHYIDISTKRWEAQIAKRNEAVQRGETSAYYVDEGLKEKCVSLFEPPCRDEIDIWYTPEE
ncbi:MAG: ATP-binding protein [Clostridiales bacterium]|nr:ATP-binding protein [Clostridiales bacterium]